MKMMYNLKKEEIFFQLFEEIIDKLMLIFLEKVCICKMFITGDLMYIFDVY